ncbi:MAG: hypothetical protein HY260_18805 [Chloroflexi bacterium]|nr:hypothetical protein [Chloroflexota bacterium]
MARRPTPMEFGSLPMDPMYAWGIKLEPVDKLIVELNDYIEQLAKETYDSGREFSDAELERLFLKWFDDRVADGTFRRLPDEQGRAGRAVVGPAKWIKAQRTRINRLVAWWKEQGGTDI